MIDIRRLTRRVQASIPIVRFDRTGTRHELEVLADADVYFLPAEDCYPAEGDIDNIETRIVGGLPQWDISEDNLSDDEWEELRRRLFDSYLREACS